MDHVRPMDSAEIWILLVLTVIIHGATFYYLQYVANFFRVQMMLSATQGSTKDVLFTTPTHSNPPSTKPTYHIHNLGEHRRDNIAALRMEPNSRVLYQPLHDTLDVSIFR